jgi:hypothetical protein
MLHMPPAGLLRVEAMKMLLVAKGWQELAREGESAWTADVAHIHALRQALRRELLELMLAYQAGHFKRDQGVSDPPSIGSEIPS